MTRDEFETLAAALLARCGPDEVLLCYLRAETSDFVRFNHNRVRQAGSVEQRRLQITLVRDERQAAAGLELAGDPARDLAQCEQLLRTLRQQIRHLPRDPHLHYNTMPENTEETHAGDLPDAADMMQAIRRAAAGMDLVGILSRGSQFRGFANSLGQRNWHQAESWNLDWSCHHHADKAIKHGLAGFRWDAARLAREMERVRAQLDVMGRPPVTIEPGDYRVYLAPAAVQELLDLVGWGGFALKAHRTAQTPLIKMITEDRRLHPAVTLGEDNRRGLAPRFTAEGFVKPDKVDLIEGGRYRDCLADARSAREYGVKVNADSGCPGALDMQGGKLEEDEVLAQLGTGVYVSNLWYCNFSDRNDCRITGMTRFGTLWVEHGRPKAPLEPMRFDDSVYNLLGDALEDLAREPLLMVDPGTYGERSTASARLPGALISNMRFTL